MEATSLSRDRRANQSSSGNVLEQGMNSYSMSSQQLNELWKEESMWQNILLNMPLRKCSAPPSNWGTKMPDNEFNALKSEVLKMYIKAAMCMAARETPPYGYGLYALNDTSEISLTISKTRFADLGYVVKVPTFDECPTSHRYLRSPFMDDCYIGGPISIANHEKLDGNLQCTFVSSINHGTGRKYHHVRVYSKKSNALMLAGKELTWDYTSKKDKGEAEFYPKHCWFQDCCSEESHSTQEQSTHFDIDSECKTSSEPPLKKKKFSQTANAVPRRDKYCQTYKPCTYCGINMDSTLVGNSEKMNYKRHYSTQHTIDIRNEIHGGCELETLDQRQFVMHIDKVSIVLNKLKASGYQVIPACKYFEVNGLTPADCNGNEEEQLQLFKQFEKTASREFSLKKIIYLKGISIPASYEDLLWSGLPSNFSKIKWENNKRPNDKVFSLKQLELSKEEIADHDRDKVSKLRQIMCAFLTV